MIPNKLRTMIYQLSPNDCVKGGFGIKNNRDIYNLSLHSELNVQSGMLKLKPTDDIHTTNVCMYIGCRWEHPVWSDGLKRIRREALGWKVLINVTAIHCKADTTQENYNLCAAIKIAGNILEHVAVISTWQWKHLAIDSFSQAFHKEKSKIKGIRGLKLR